MKKHLSQPSNKLLFSKARVTCLSPDDMDQVVGGFQVGPNSCNATGPLFSPLVPGLPLLTQYDPAR
jgi:hypothetical protein